MLDERQIVELLRARGSDQEWLFEESRRQRNSAYGERVVLRGVVEITNQCRVNCDFCPMRRDNSRKNDIFRLGSNDLVRAADQIRAAGINVVFFQGGEIPQTTRVVGDAIPQIRTSFGDNVEVLLNLGNKSLHEYAYLREQGATSYILKHETSDPALNEKMRHEPLDQRLRCLADLLKLGYKVGTGLIVGLPNQTQESMARDILLAKKLGVHMCSVSPFVPAPNTPLEQAQPGSIEIALNAIAVMRIISPEWLIPSVSALEKTQEEGQLRGLHAGANVITINFSTGQRTSQYLIYGRDRFIVKLDYARSLIARSGLKPSKSVFAGSNSIESRLMMPPTKSCQA